MKTRKKVKQQQETPTVSKHPVGLKLRINKFINPSTTYRIFNNFFIKQQTLSKSLQKQIPHQSYFEFNKIVKGKVIGNFIEFMVIPTSREFEFNDEYIIQRFLSFGDKEFKRFADTMLVLKELRKEIRGVMDEFPKFENVVERFNSQKPMIIWNDNPGNMEENGSSEPGMLLVSLSYMNRYGWTNPESYILDCIKSGNLCLPFLIDPEKSQSYMDRAQVKIDSIINEIKQAIYQKSLKSLEYSISDAENTEEKHISTQSNTLVTNSNNLNSYRRVLEVNQQFKTYAETVKVQFFQSPFLFCSQHVEYKSHNFTQNEINKVIENCGTEEYDLLEKLVHVPQNRLGRFASKVCSYRSIVKKEEEEDDEDDDM